MSGRPVPEHDDASAPFWRACAEHRLIVQRCEACGVPRHPPRPMCPSCGSMQAGWIDASGRARLWSWVVAHPPVVPAFADRAPYPVGVVELAEGVRMIGSLLGVANPDIVEGMAMRVRFEDVEEGVALPAWEPAE